MSAAAKSSTAGWQITVVGGEVQQAASDAQPNAQEARSGDVFEFGPWLAEVDDADLKAYLKYAEASEAVCGPCGPVSCRDCCYSRQLNDGGAEAKGEAFGWLCNMHVARLPEGGCLVYSAVLGPDGTAESVKAQLQARDLLPVRVVVAPSPKHHLALAKFQKVFPDAFYVCGEGSEQMPPLTVKRPDVRFDALLCVGEGVKLRSPIEGEADSKRLDAIAESLSAFEVVVCDDQRSTEVVLCHKQSQTLLISDLLYKAATKSLGPGGPKHRYTLPEWYAQGQDELFYHAPNDPSGNLLPTYRTHPKVVRMDTEGARKALEYILTWSFRHCLGCHVDPLDGDEARRLLQQAWAWLLQPTEGGANRSMGMAAINV